MRITLTGPNDTIWTQEVSGELDLATLKMLSAVDLGLDFNTMIILRNGQPMTSDSMNLDSAGVKDGDILMALPGNLFNRQRPVETGSARPTGPINWHEKAQSMLDQFLAQNESTQRAALANIGDSEWKNAIQNRDVAKIADLIKQRHDTEMAERERLRQAEANPMDPENQRYLEERIRQQNIDDSYRSAMENSPEMFGTVIMLYINVKVNGRPVKAFVDSGAQMTIMSQACAERCHCMRLLDTRFAGIARGVGTQKILGRVHTGQIQINDAFIPQSFSVMEDQPMDLLIGLDMLKRHQCVLDLAKGTLTIGTTGTVANFLSEGELDGNARLSGPAAEAAQSEEMEIEKALEASAAEHSATAPAASGSSSVSSDNRPPAEQLDPKVSQVMEMTKCSRSAATEALAKANGDPNSAALSILTSSFTK